MNLPSAPAGRRPSGLGDPLLSLRNLILGLIALAVVSYATPTVFEQPSGMGPLRLLHDYLTLATLTVWLLAFLLAPILLVLPHRRTNAFYLRAFAHDEATGALRLVLQRALGRGFRLSGIRDPQRRSSLFLRSVTVFVFCFRYSTVRYMNLEAGADWLHRLARSLDDARCVFMDLSQMTGPLEDELQLAAGQVGLERLMFLSRTARDAGELRDLVAGRLGIAADARARIHAAVWPGEPGAGRQDFDAAVRRFVAQLPAGTVRPRPGGSTAPAGLPPLVPDSMLRRWRLALTEYAGLAILPVSLTLYQYGAFATMAIGNANPSDLTRRLVAIGIPVVNWSLLALALYLGYAILRYFIECGSIVGRVKAAAIFAFYAGLPLYLESRV